MAIKVKFLDKIRQQIRLSLLEEFDVTNTNTQTGEQLDYDPESVENLAKMARDRAKMQRDMLSSMNKSFSIPSHPDKTINGQLKRAEKTKMDDIEKSIEDAEKEEEELKKTGEAMKKLSDLNKQYAQTISQTKGASSSPDSNITNM